MSVQRLQTKNGDLFRIMTDVHSVLSCGTAKTEADLMENSINTAALLELAISLGYHLQMCGAEIFRVEEAVNRLLHAYHTPGDVFVIPHCIIVTVCPDDAEPMTRMRRSFSPGLDIDGLERYYGLARRLCSEKPSLEEACRMLQKVKQAQTSFRIPVLYLGYFLASGAFSIFFGGTVTDGIFAGCIGMLIGWFLRISTRLQVNAFFKTITASFGIAILSQLLTHLTFIRYADAAAIGALMLLVPGITFTDSMRDFLYGDTLSGMNKMVNVVLTAAAILLGTGAALHISKLIWDTASIGISLNIPYSGWIQVIAGIAACGGFCILYNIRMPGLLFCMAGGGIGWAVYLCAKELGASLLIAHLLAAASISLYAEIMARIRKYPAFSYLIVALLPLVPGAGIYYTVEYLLQKEMSSSLTQGIETAVTAGILAVGMLGVSSVFRMVSVARQMRTSDGNNNHNKS